MDVEVAEMEKQLRKCRIKFDHQRKWIITPHITNEPKILVEMLIELAWRGYEVMDEDIPISRKILVRFGTVVA